MSNPSNRKAPASEGKKAAGLDRRRFFMMGGSAVAAAATVPLASGEAAADDESRAERVKARRPKKEIEPAPGSYVRMR